MYICNWDNTWWCIPDVTMSKRDELHLYFLCGLSSQCPVPPKWWFCLVKGFMLKSRSCGSACAFLFCSMLCHNPSVYDRACIPSDGGGVSVSDGIRSLPMAFSTRFNWFDGMMQSLVCSIICCYFLRSWSQDVLGSINQCHSTQRSIRYASSSWKPHKLWRESTATLLQYSTW